MNVYKYTSRFTELREKKKHICLSNLPWDKIFLRVNRLIKQIYYETKKHNIRCAYQLQMYIINSIDLKIFVFKHIVFELYTLYYLDRDLKYRFGQKNREQKVKIKSQNQEIDLRKILKQHLIYLCTKPMFDARLPKSYEQICRLRKNKYCIKKGNYYYYQNIKYIEKKLKLPNYIKENIIYCMETLSYVDILKLYTSKYKINTENYKYLSYVRSLKYKSFLHCILDILDSTDYMWYNFTYIKRAKNRIGVLDNSNLYVPQFIKSFKYGLKFKFLLKKIRFSRYLESTKKQNFLVNRLFPVYENWYSVINQFVDLSNTNLYNYVINQAIFSWIKKQNFSVLLNTRNTSTLNVILNKKTYIYNIKRYYL